MSIQFTPEQKKVWNMAIRAAAERAKNSCLVPPDGGSPSEAEIEHADRAAEAVLTIISD